MSRKLKLTKLTVSNLDHVKGGYTPHQCACYGPDPNQVAQNQIPTQYTIICSCGPEC